ncbi:protein of unknown function [Burkholderia multivorans]
MDRRPFAEHLTGQREGRARLRARRLHDLSARHRPRLSRASRGGPENDRGRPHTRSGTPLRSRAASRQTFRTDVARHAQEGLSVGDRAGRAIRRHRGRTRHRPRCFVARGARGTVQVAVGSLHGIFLQLRCGACASVRRHDRELREPRRASRVGTVTRAALVPPSAGARKDRLDLWMNGIRVGYREVRRGVERLVYLPEWVADEQGRPLSLSLPFPPGNQPHQGAAVRICSSFRSDSSATCRPTCAPLSRTNGSARGS